MNGAKNISFNEGQMPLLAHGKCEPIIRAIAEHRIQMIRSIVNYSILFKCIGRYWFLNSNMLQKNGWAYHTGSVPCKMYLK